MKSGIKYIRGNLSHDLWIYTHEKIDYLREDEWTNNATKKLIDFENEILKTMKTDGWDGNILYLFIFVIFLGESRVYFNKILNILKVLRIQNVNNGHRWEPYSIRLSLLPQLVFKISIFIK